jgi:hypothetical protein
VSVSWDGTIPRRRENGVSRRTERAESSLPVTVRTRWRKYAAQAVNIGPEGLALLSSTRFQVGDELTIAFTLPNRNLEIHATAIVRHTTGYVHGLEFWTMTEHDRLMVASYVEERTKAAAHSSQPAQPAV